MINMTDSLKRANDKIDEATENIKIMSQYSPTDAQVSTYLYAFKNVMKRYETMQELMNNAEDQFDNLEEADQNVYDSADDVVCAVKSFYNDINAFEEYQKQINKK